MRARDASASRGFAPRIPLVVVGALRAGGSGKTSVTLALARSLADRGLRPALLAYRLGPGPGPRPRPRQNAGDPRAGDPRAGDPRLIEILSGDEWRESSEEALLLRRGSAGSGRSRMRVFATRNRAQAWRLLQEERYQADGGFDILISDDGFQDPRLHGAYRIVLTAPGERPGLFDLLPGGPFRETRGAMARAHLRIEGPMSGQGPACPRPAGVTSALPIPSFTRTLIPPPDLDRHRPWIAFCALGDNRPFLADLERAGIRPVAVVTGRNHAAPPLKKLQSVLAMRPEAGILCTRKDFLKLDAAAAGLPLYPVDQSISLDPAIPDAVMAWLVPRQPNSETKAARD
jgi:tetraacyldisaccharide-1-P 4'-kinase